MTALTHQLDSQAFVKIKSKIVKNLKTEIKFFRFFKYSSKFDHTKNNDIRKELNIFEESIERMEKKQK